MYNLPTPESQIFSAVTKIVSAHSLKNKSKGTQKRIEEGSLKITHMKLMHPY